MMLKRMMTSIREEEEEGSKDKDDGRGLRRYGRDGGVGFRSDLSAVRRIDAN